MDNSFDNTFKVGTVLDTGISVEEAGWNEGESPNGEFSNHSFATEAEAQAFILGIEIASDATHNWTQGTLSASLEKPKNPSRKP